MEDRDAQRTAALAAHEARLQPGAETIAADDAVAADEACPEGTTEWARAPDAIFCATICVSDAMCAPDERCRVLGMQNSPDEPALYADDVSDLFLEAAALQASIDEAGPIYDDPPPCEGSREECEYVGDLEIKPVVPFALCDPFAD